MSANTSASVYCLQSPSTHILSITFHSIRYLLLGPLSIFILYLGYRRWRQQRSFNTTSHSDIFTYHMAALLLVGCLGTPFYLSQPPNLTFAGYCLISVNYFGETFFNILACVERYLAVVHPIVYRGLRSARGVRIRNISTGCVWLLSVGYTYLISLSYPEVPVVFFILYVSSSLAVVFLCSICVLWALIRPGPGEGGGDRKSIDQSKQRAFLTIVAITAVLVLWFMGFLVTYVLSESLPLSRDVACVVLVSGYWFNLPSTLILPLLYLHRAGKLPRCHSASG